MVESNLTKLMSILVKGFSVAKAAQSFGVQQSLASKVLRNAPFTANEFLKKGGDLTGAADPKSFRGFQDRLTTVSELQKFRQSSANDRIKQKTNTVAFAVENAVKLPFETQGDLRSLAGHTGRRLNISA